MASTLVFYNNAYTTLAGAITNIATTANLAPGSGALFQPTIGAGQEFKITFIDAATGLLNEIVNVTAISGDTITMVRGQEGTTPLNWQAGDLADNLWTAGSAAAMIQNIQFSPARIVTTSGPFAMSSSDTRIGLQRVASPAASSTTLPADAQIGQVFTIEDLVGNFQPYNVTVNAPVGMSIANLSSVTLNVNRQSASFAFYGSDVWSLAL